MTAGQGKGRRENRGIDRKKRDKRREKKERREGDGKVSKWILELKNKRLDIIIAERDSRESIAASGSAGGGSPCVLCRWVVRDVARLSLHVMIPPIAMWNVQG